MTVNERSVAVLEWTDGRSPCPQRKVLGSRIGGQVSPELAPLVWECTTLFPYQAPHYKLGTKFQNINYVVFSVLLYSGVYKAGQQPHNVGILVSRKYIREFCCLQ